MHVAIVDLFSIKSFVTAKEPEDDIGPEILLAGQGLSFTLYIDAFIQENDK